MEVLAASEGSSILFLIGLLMVVGILLMRAQRHLKRGAPTPATSKAAPGPSGTVGELTLPADAPKGLARWEVSLHEVAREHSARLDTKIAALQQLIRTAQQESARLEALLAEAGRAPQNRRADAPAAPVAPKPHTAPGQLSLAHEAVARRPAARSGESRPYERIYALADAGRDRAAIARELNLPLGEVDLVLDLRRSQ